MNKPAHSKKNLAAFLPVALAIGDIMKKEIQTKFESYPQEANSQLTNVRRLIFSVARDSGLSSVEETLKWSQVSYLVKGGSTIRIDWKPKEPDVIKIYFHCQTSLVETFKEIYGEQLRYEGKRAVIIPLKAKIEEGPLAHCIELALRYHSLKKLPLLGV